MIEQCSTCTWWTKAAVRNRDGWGLRIWHNGTKNAAAQTVDIGRSLMRTNAKFGCTSWKESEERKTT